MKLGAALIGALALYYSLLNSVNFLQADVRRIEQNEISTLKRQDEEFKQLINRLRDEATSERLRQTEILTEVRTDVRQMRAIIERLERPRQ